MRLIADHLGVTSGTVARALARLTAAGLVQRQDRRDGVTGRFVESVYIVAPTAGIVPCVDCPHTAEPHRAGWPAPATNRSDDDAGQRLPEGMASVCRPLIGGHQPRRASTIVSDSPIFPLLGVPDLDHRRGSLDDFHRAGVAIDPEAIAGVQVSGGGDGVDDAWKAQFAGDDGAMAGCPADVDHQG